MYPRLPGVMASWCSIVVVFAMISAVVSCTRQMSPASTVAVRALQLRSSHFSAQSSHSAFWTAMRDAHCAIVDVAATGDVEGVGVSSACGVAEHAERAAARANDATAAAATRDVPIGGA